MYYKCRSNGVVVTKVVECPTIGMAVRMFIKINQALAIAKPYIYRAIPYFTIGSRCCERKVVVHYSIHLKLMGFPSWCIFVTLLGPEGTHPKILYWDQLTMTFLNAPTVAMMPTLRVKIQIIFSTISKRRLTGYSVR